MKPSMKEEEIRQAVRRQYGILAKGENAGCGCGPACCNVSLPGTGTDSRELGYTADEADSVPPGADMGLGCGNPRAIAALKPGEIVLDLGSGGGFDGFLAARQVGEDGRVIGVDMTPEMVSKARAAAEKSGYRNIEFRLGEIENLPVADGTVDVIISNCVINLSPDKRRVFEEAYRVLKPGGRLAISDVVAIDDMPDEIRRDLALYTGCVAGASLVPEIEAMLAASGFTEIRVTPKAGSKTFIRNWVSGVDITKYVLSADIEAVKPVSGRCEPPSERMT